MADDYFDLAHLTDPKLMTASGGFGGTYGGMMYQEQLNRHNAMLDQATKLAEIQARRKAMEAGEYEAGNPGRMSEIGLGNAVSGAKLQQLPNVLETVGNQAQTANTQSKTARIAAARDQLAQYMPRWNAAKSDEEKEDIRNEMVNNGVNNFGGKNNIKDAPISAIDSLFKGMYQGAVNTPAHAQEMEKYKQIGINWKERAHETGEEGQARERIRQEGAQQRTEMLTKVREHIAEMNKQKPTTIAQQMGSLFQKITDGTATEFETALFNKQTANHPMIVSELLKAQAMGAPVDLEKVAPGMTRPTPKMPDMTLPVKPKAGLDLQKGIYTNDKGQSQPIASQIKDAKGTIIRYELKDGTQVPAS